VRFLIDRCAGRRLAESLAGEGHDVLEARTLGPDPGDADLLRIAAGQKRILVTMDKDFGVLLFRDHAAHAGILRLPDLPAKERIALVHSVLRSHGRELEGGAAVTVRGNKIRVSREA